MPGRKGFSVRLRFLILQDWTDIFERQSLFRCQAILQDDVLPDLAQASLAPPHRYARLRGANRMHPVPLRAGLRKDRARLFRELDCQRSVAWPDAAEDVATMEIGCRLDLFQMDVLQKMTGSMCWNVHGLCCFQQP